MGGDGVMGHGIREALLTAEIGKLTNCQGGGDGQKRGWDWNNMDNDP